jgi:hypothetical protein
VSRRLGARLVAVLIVFGTLASLFVGRDNRPNFSDFKVYWVAGDKAAEHRTVYDVQGHYQFKYSPFVALLWALPVAILPGTKFHWAWLHYAGSAVGWYGLWFWLARSVDRKRAFWLWLMLVAVFSVGLRDELKLGQANLWPCLLALPAWFTPARERAPRGFDARGFGIGVAWGLAIQWKLYALLLAPLWLLRRRAQVGVGAIVVTVLTLGIALGLAHGWQFALTENARWLHSLTQSSEQLLISQYNVSTLGIIGKWSTRPGDALPAYAYAVWIALAATWLAVLFWAEREARQRAQPFFVFWSASWAWAAVVILNPLVWPYWLLFCAPLFLAYLSEAWATGLCTQRLRLCVVCALFTLMNWLQNYPIVHGGGSLVAVLLLLGDAYARARARDTAQLAQLSQLHLPLPSTPV